MEITAAHIKAAYEATNLKLGVGLWYDATSRTACPLAALAIEKNDLCRDFFESDPYDDYEIERVIAEELGLAMEYVQGFIYAYDNDTEPDDWTIDPQLRQGMLDGRAARLGMVAEPG